MKYVGPALMLDFTKAEGLGKDSDTVNVVHYSFTLVCCILQSTETEDVFHYSLKIAFLQQMKSQYEIKRHLSKQTAPLL